MTDYTAALESFITTETVDAMLQTLSRDDLTNLARVAVVYAFDGTEIVGGNVDLKAGEAMAKRVRNWLEDNFDAECRANEYERGGDIVDSRKFA